ncbi:hypothetical protein BD779DRAFT_1524713 [Infundibulicybe gibba]|nr:hypothetical protein BD779DRAFT_1524713 [Infundibulicybe gibba]
MKSQAQKSLPPWAFDLAKPQNYPTYPCSMPFATDLQIPTSSSEHPAPSSIGRPGHHSDCFLKCLGPAKLKVATYCFNAVRAGTTPLMITAFRSQATSLIRDSTSLPTPRLSADLVNNTSRDMTKLPFGAKQHRLPRIQYHSPDPRLSAGLVVDQ